jgi:hypothetical protein
MMTPLKCKLLPSLVFAFFLPLICTETSIYPDNGFYLWSYVTLLAQNIFFPSSDRNIADLVVDRLNPSMKPSTAYSSSDYAINATINI